MPNLNDIKERIGSTVSTRKITQSLELVAASKMKGFVKKAVASRQYADRLLQIMQKTSGEFEATGYGEVRETGKTVFVLLTSDKGLCGNLNQRLIRFLFQSPRWKNVDPEDRLLITIGRKGSEAARRSGYKVHKKYEALGENISPLTSLSVIEEIVELWNNGTAKEVLLVSPTYVSPFIQHVKIHSYLPFTGTVEEDEEASDDILIEPDPGTVAETAGFQVIFSLFMRSFYELKASEYSSRMVAMKKASDAALEMISVLTLEYNKARQAKITAQVSELATAGEAMAEESELVYATN